MGCSLLNVGCSVDLLSKLSRRIFSATNSVLFSLQFPHPYVTSAHLNIWFGSDVQFLEISLKLGKMYKIRDYCVRPEIAHPGGDLGPISHCASASQLCLLAM